MTRDSNDNLKAKHERLLKAYNFLVVLINTKTMFRYLDETLVLDKEYPRTNNPWWCDLHSPRPLSAKEILKVMPTDGSISKIYRAMNKSAQPQGIIPTWGDTIFGGDLHNYDKLSFNDLD